MGVGEESLFVLTQLYNMPEEGKDVNDQMPILGNSTKRWISLAFA